MDIVRGTALVCDDDSQLRSLVSRLLTDDGWEVVASVPNAVEAIDLTQRLHPDVVVIDVALSGLSGIEAIPELVLAGATVVVCSAFGGYGDPARNAGAAAVVDKCDLETLAGVVRAAVFPASSPVA